jgi:small subunit ribosomal protein S7
MSRRQRAVKRDTPPDPQYGSTTVTKFVSNLMLAGKKSTAERIVYGSMRISDVKSGVPAMNVFVQAVNNAKRGLEVRCGGGGGAASEVPGEVRPERRNALAMKWLVGFARARGDKTMADRLAQELIAASRNEGGTIKKKEDTHRMAEANKAFAHYRW